MQVLAAEDFDIRQSVSKVALVRQSMVGWIGERFVGTRTVCGLSSQGMGGAHGLCARGGTSSAC